MYKYARQMRFSSILLKLGTGKTTQVRSLEILVEFFSTCWFQSHVFKMKILPRKRTD